MNRATARRARFAIGALICSFLCSNASAHAPLARRAALSADGSAAAISLPGFGILIRSATTNGFAYVCDALLGVYPSDAPHEMAFVEGGALLVGSSSGLRRVAPGGCPERDVGGALASAPIVGLAAHPDSLNVVYAVTQTATSTTATRSSDGGRTWETGATWPEVGPVTALVLGDTDVNSMSVSQLAPGGRSRFRVSGDGGASFSSFDSDVPRELLAVQDSTTPRFWAVARSPGSIGNRGFDLVHADSPDGPWTTALQVNFFGGFTIEPSGAIWMGDEGGGVYRSLDGAVTFTNIAPSTAVACLTYGEGTVWGCTPGIPEQPALVQWNDTTSTFDDAATLREVTHMAECDPAMEVEKVCAAAWAEWKRDVLMIPPPTMAPADAGAAPAPEPDSSCSLAARTGTRGAPRGTALIAFAALLLGIRKGPGKLGSCGPSF